MVPSNFSELLKKSFITLGILAQAQIPCFDISFVEFEPAIVPFLSVPIFTQIQK